MLPMWAGWLGLSLCLAPAFGQATAEPAQTSTPGPYRIQRGDFLDIRVYNFPDLNQEVVVLPDGKISIPLVMEIQADGRTPAELASALTKALELQVRSPKVSVVVKGFAGRNVFVGGEVGTPMQVPLVGPLTAVQAIFQAGGIKDSSDTFHVALIRHSSSGAPETISVNVNDILNHKAQDVPLVAGDVLYVPKSIVNVYVGGEVERSGLQPLNRKLTLLAAVLSAGGMKRTAKRDSVIVLRDDGTGKALVSKVNLDEIMKGGTDMVLQPYDVVLVPKSTIAKLNDFVELYIRQMNPATLSLGFSYLIGFPTQTIF